MRDGNGFRWDSGIRFLLDLIVPRWPCGGIFILRSSVVQSINFSSIWSKTRTPCQLLVVWLKEQKDKSAMYSPDAFGHKTVS